MGVQFTRAWLDNVLVSLRGLIVTQQGWAFGFLASFLLVDVELFRSLASFLMPEWVLGAALVPDWVWWSAAYVLLGLSTFVAFHRERQWAEEILADRDRVLKSFREASRPVGNGEL